MKNDILLIEVKSEESTGYLFIYLISIEPLETSSLMLYSPIPYMPLT